MSHSFYINDVPQLRFDEVIAGLGLGDVRLVEGHAQADDGKWPEGTSYLYQHGRSVRPVESTFENGCLQLRIFAYSSPDDYRFALRVIEKVAQLTGRNVEPEDNESLTLDQLKAEYGEAWLKPHCLSMLQALVRQHRENPTAQMTMAGALADMTMGPRMFAELLKDPQRFSHEFFGRFRRLNYLEEEGIGGSLAMRMREVESGLEFMVGLYTSGSATVLPGTLDSVLLQQGEAGCEVPFETLRELLGERATWLSEDLLLAPALDDDQWAQLNRDAGPYALSRGSVAAAEESGEADGLTENASEILELFCTAPLLAFIIVAGADGKVDAKEYSAFQKQLVVGAFLSESNLFSASMQHLISNFQPVLAMVQGSSLAPLAMLSAVSLSLDKMFDAEEANAFRKAVHQVGQKVAEASGGFMGMFGSKVSKHEQRALDAIAEVLGLN